jgi:hypothetical protein
MFKRSLLTFLAALGLGGALTAQAHLWWNLQQCQAEYGKEATTPEVELKGTETHSWLLPDGYYMRCQFVKDEVAIVTYLRTDRPFSQAEMEALASKNIPSAHWNSTPVIKDNGAEEEYVAVYPDRHFTGQNWNTGGHIIKKQLPVNNATGYFLIIYSDESASLLSVLLPPTKPEMGKSDAEIEKSDADAADRFAGWYF